VVASEVTLVGEGEGEPLDLYQVGERRENALAQRQPREETETALAKHAH
jgi:hypothetical protein